MGRYSDALDEQDMLGKWLVSSQGQRYIRGFCSKNDDVPLDRNGNLLDEPPDRDPGYEVAYTEVWKSIVDNGEPFYWSSQMCELLESAAETLPEWRLDEQLLPSVHGFMLFERPLAMTPAIWINRPESLEGCPDATPDPIKGIGWTSIYVEDPKTRQPTGDRYVIVGYIIVEDDTKYAPRIRGQYGIPTSTVQWRPGSTITDEWIRTASTGDGTDAFGNENSEKRYIEGLRYFGAAMLLLNQSVFVAKKEQPERATRRRVSKLRDVNVVYLRRAMRADGSHRSASEIEHAYQWFVASHWRYLGACEGCRNARSRCRHNMEGRRPVLVPGHIKGPEDMPVKGVSRIVNAVVR